MTRSLRMVVGLALTLSFCALTEERAQAYGFASADSRSIHLVEKFMERFPLESIAGDDSLFHCKTNWNEFVEVASTFSVSTECAILGDMYRNKKVTIKGRFDGVHIFIDNIVLSDIHL